MLPTQSSLPVVSTFTILLSLLLTADSMVISPRWEHLRWKTLPPARVDVRRSGEMTLSCSATGSPAPDLAWYKDGLFVPHLELGQEEEEEEEGKSLGETVAKLRLGCMGDNMEGVYECRARAGKQELNVVTEVNIVDWEGEDVCIMTGKPEIAVWSPTLMVEEGHTALLRCRDMEHRDDVNIVWRDEEGKEVGDGERQSITEKGDLVIRQVTFKDMGTYSCTLENTRGQDSVSTFLYPLAPNPTIK